MPPEAKLYFAKHQVPFIYWYLLPCLLRRSVLLHQETVQHRLSQHRLPTCFLTHIKDNFPPPILPSLLTTLTRQSKRKLPLPHTLNLAKWEEVLGRDVLCGGKSLRARSVELGFSHGYLLDYYRDRVKNPDFIAWYKNSQRVKKSRRSGK